MNKKCIICSIEKSILEFYGKMRICKICHSARNKKRYEEAIKDPAYILRERARSRAYQDKTRGMKTKFDPRSHMARWRAENDVKVKAETRARDATKKGILKSPGVCEDCLVATSKLHRHHEDYSKPLDVVWVCPKCHGKRHQRINAERLLHKFGLPF